MRRPATLAGARARGLLLRRMRLVSLYEQLSRYLPESATEAGFVARMLELTRADGACSRSHFEPGHFTASAFVLGPGGGELGLIHHRKLGIWVQPGGHVDADDPDLSAAARREVEEEIGLSALEPWTSGGGEIFDLDIHVIPARKAEPLHEHFDVRFAFLSASRTLRPSEEVLDARWLPLNDVRTLTTDRSVLRAVDKLLRWKAL
jgi:8-oxo-dGTP pyrophosphatase MutT (NUDIX family)